MDTVVTDKKPLRGKDAAPPSAPAGGVTLVAIDDGYADTKAYLQSGVSVTIPSRVRTGAHGLIEAVSSGDLASDASYTTEERKFTVGRHVQGEDTRYDGFHLSPHNRVIVHHALRAAGVGGKRVRVAVGLPVGSFYRDGQPNEALIASKRANLQVPVKLLGASSIPCATIDDVFVCAQGVTAWIDYAFDDKGQPRPGVATGPVAVVDIGGRTTDCVVVLPPAQIDPQRSGTLNVGALDVRESLVTAICREYGLDSLPDQLAETALRTGAFKLSGEVVDVSKLKQMALEAHLGRVEDAIKRFFGQGVDIEQIIFVGGGADLMRSLQQGRRNAVMPENPAYANARGMLKFLVMQEKQFANG
jgi:plasmid segregation protein ParM